MATQTFKTLDQFDWAPQPAAAAYVGGLLDEICRRCEPARELELRLLNETGTRLHDWIDHLAVPADEAPEARLTELGFERQPHGSWTIWRHPGGMFPPLHSGRGARRHLAIRAESVVDFLLAYGARDAEILGEPLSALRKAKFASAGDADLWVFERHGYREFEPAPVSAEQAELVLAHGEALRRRRRHFDDAPQGFDHAMSLVRAARRDLGVDRACDLFFSAAREYWQSRNTAGRVQKARQDRLGLGWANHDHHTYRSSREHFPRLIAVLEELGFQCRERFYGGHGAGWGAQVLEQPTVGVVIFADVDLTPEEVSGDFAHEPLPHQSHLGTVGLWCKLHGEAFLEAGMHHLECQFDFDAAREQLRAAGIQTMTPFTDFPHLKQAFTEGEVWPVSPARVERALTEGAITPQQAEQFRRAGALGSHLEILERNDGYKGFNQTGISEIITKTDPRKQHG